MTPEKQTFMKKDSYWLYVLRPCFRWQKNIIVGKPFRFPFDTYFLDLKLFLQNVWPKIFVFETIRRKKAFISSLVVLTLWRVFCGCVTVVSEISQDLFDEFIKKIWMRWRKIIFEVWTFRIIWSTTSLKDSERDSFQNKSSVTKGWNWRKTTNLILLQRTSLPTLHFTSP